MIAYFRTDASILIGSGHVIRCLTLAGRLASVGYKAIFICRDLPGNLITFIEEKGFNCLKLPYSRAQKAEYEKLPLNDDYELWRGVSLEQDRKETSQILKDNSAVLLVIDSYSLDTRWEEKIRPFTKRIMVIDDLANREHDCDILLDHNFYVNYETRYNGLVGEKCKKLLGPRFALINPELEIVKKNRQTRGKTVFLKDINNILVFLGGMDAKNYTQLAVDKIMSTAIFNEVMIHVVIGRRNPNKLRLKSRYHREENIIFHVQPNYYYELIEKADLAVGGGGVSVLERSFIGLPAFLICIADNQKEIIDSSIRVGASKDFADLDKFSQNLTNTNFARFETSILDINEVVRC